MSKVKPKKRVKPQRVKPQAALAVREPPSTPMGVFERLAKDKTIDVDKLEKLIALQKDILLVQAKAAYGVAFSRMQGELPTIDKRGKIIVKGALRSRYAKLEDIQTAVKPILQRHGFSLRHRTEWPREGLIRVVGILSHSEGHAEESAFEGPLDESEYRTQIQSMGSTVSYGRRYTTIDLLNITQRGVDDDGQGGPPPREHRPDPKAGEPITQPQRQRLWVIAKHAGRTQEELKAWLAVAYGIETSKAILRRDYEAICTAVEHPGPLPAPVSASDGREPGSDDE
mgnify:CR=1 FL=1